MPQAIIPWEPQNIPIEIQAELNRRKVNRSFTYIDGAKGGGWGEGGDWEKYRGPMSPWIRVCSNGAGKPNKALSDQYESDYFDRQGFVFFGGKDFYSGYGFRTQFTTGGSGNDSIIGYMPDGTPHTIDNSLTSQYPIHVPSPEIEKISVVIQKELYRKASIDWICFSKTQLEYMTPYFLVPGISCVLEWGWNHFNPECLLDLNNTTQLKEYRKNPYPLYTEHIIPSKGNYDVMIGIVTNFEWSCEGNKFKCKTEVTTPDRIYAGLALDSSITINSNSENSDEPERPFGNLTKFIDEALPEFKTVGASKNPYDIPQLQDFIKYLAKHHPDMWEEYAYGIFYGRDPKDTSDNGVKAAGYDNKDKDFDRKEPLKNLWINLGLAIECINYHVKPMKSFGEAEMFRVDIDDVVVTAHPNLISTDGTVLLIPNAEAPKYFNGRYGITEVDKNGITIPIKNVSDYSLLDNASRPMAMISKEKAQKSKPCLLADYQINAICKPNGNKIWRDDLDVIINKIRYDNTNRISPDCAFPNFVNKDILPASKPYPERYSGYLKHLYVNVDFLKRLATDDSVKTYTQFIDKLFTGISNAAAGFWDFRLLPGTGTANEKLGTPATLKVADYKFNATLNRGTPFTFDYFDADSLLLGIGFKPTLSNAQAIRTIYAQTNQPDKNVTVTNGTNELLDYMFKDRLMLDEDKGKKSTASTKQDDQFTELMRNLQHLTPCSDALQMTMKDDKDKVLIRRLVLPSVEILNLLLDDGDEEQNPRYTGIMPGIQANFTIQGIGGLRTFMMFLVRNLPEPYSHENVVFRIVDVQEQLESGKWTTTITAGLIPLREHIKVRLGFNTIQK